jgi:Zn-dependent protease with chaperone function
MLVLTSLWGLVFALFAGLLYGLRRKYGDSIDLIGMSLSPILFAIFIAFIFIFLQFLISPFIMDLMLNWIYDMNWVDISMLPEGMAGAIIDVTQRYNFTLGKIGIIHDGSPNAFTYGHFRNNARLVFTQGIIDLLDPKERVSVVKHEMGHIIHYDFVFMTIAQAVPLVFYMIYISSRAFMRTASKAKGKNAGKAQGVFVAIMVMSYFFYWISGYFVLFLSRLREYYADQFSAKDTNNPSGLSSALVKIAYGLVVADSETQTRLNDKETSNQDKRRMMRQNGMFNGMRSLGISDIKTAKGLMMQAYGGKNEVHPEDVAAAASWDLSSPWAKFIELGSTHPLTGKRLKALDNMAIDLGQKPKYPGLGTVKPEESLWDEFIVDLFVGYILPIVFIVYILIAVVGSTALGFSALNGVGAGLIIFALFWYYRVTIKYPSSIHDYDDLQRPVNTVLESLTSMEKDGYYESSPVRGKSIILEGIVMGKGNPGYYLSEDFVVRDETGFVTINYSSIMPLYNLWFGWRKVDQFMGQKVKVVGWYHRSIRPQVQLFRLYRSDGETHRNRWRGANLFLVGLFAIVGAVLIFIGG